MQDTDFPFAKIFVLKKPWFGIREDQLFGCGERTGQRLLCPGRERRNIVYENGNKKGRCARTPEKI